jgi:hypothetical protein
MMADRILLTTSFLVASSRSKTEGLTTAGMRRNERYVAALDLLLDAGDRIVVGVLDPVTHQASFVALRRTVAVGGDHTT